MRRRWLRRLLLFGLLLAVTDLAFVRFEFAPDHLRLTLLAAVGFMVVVLLLDALADNGADWRDEPLRPVMAPGGDQRLGAFVRLVEGHLTAAVPDAALRDRLAALCDERLARKHALTRQDRDAEDLLGSDLLHDLAGPVRRLNRAEIGRYLERIENL